MGWGRTLLLGDIGNRLDIEDLERDVAEMKRQLRRDSKGSDEDYRNLTEECAEMRLYLATLVRLLVAKGTVTKEELQSMVYAIDREDGLLDGQYNGKLQPD